MNTSAWLTSKNMNRNDPPFFKAARDKIQLGGGTDLFIQAALTDQPMEIHGDGLQTRSFTYIDDTIDGIISALFLEKAAGEIFNLGNTKEVTILDLARLVWKLAGHGELKLKFTSYQTFGKYEDAEPGPRYHKS
jgi:UDP-glucose 4-epimerase